jgi:hypothetical protein
MKHDHTPFRHRHDGWTPARQVDFLAALRETGCVRSACSHVGLTSTSAYRLKKRIPVFSDAWDLALEYRAPALERAAYERAVTGWLEPIVYKGEIVGQRRRYSDAMLRLLLQRETARVPVADAKPGRGQMIVKNATREETNAHLIKALAAAKKRVDREAHEEAVAEAERLAAAGWAP